MSPLHRHANHAKRRADAGCGQRAGITMRHHLACCGHQVRSIATHRFVCGALFSMDRARFLDHRAAQRVGKRLRGCELLEAASHALDSPEQVHSRWPRLGDRLADAWKLRAEFIESASVRSRDAKSDAQCWGHANPRGCATDHVLDPRGDVTIFTIRMAKYF